MLNPLFYSGLRLALIGTALACESQWLKWHPGLSKMGVQTLCADVLAINYTTPPGWTYLNIC